MMRKLLVCIAFHGGAYHGWQVQANAHTVQERVQDAIEQLFGIREDISGCSRTDAGVHARRYYFHMKANTSLPLPRIIRSLNALLPDTISVQNIWEVPPDFHARYSAIGKEYLYQIWNEPSPNPFLLDQSFHYPYLLKIEPMQEALHHLMGTHDFTSFCSQKSSVQDKVRTLTKGTITCHDSLIQIRIGGNGFLYHMVRIIVGTLLFVSQGKIQPEEIPEILNRKDRYFAGKTVPAHGLFLYDVYYKQECMYG